MEKDFYVADHGSVWLIHPLNDAAEEHLKASVAEDAQWFGRALAVEARYVGDLLEGLTEEGFIV